MIYLFVQIISLEYSDPAKQRIQFHFLAKTGTEVIPELSSPTGPDGPYSALSLLSPLFPFLAKPSLLYYIKKMSAVTSHD